MTRIAVLLAFVALVTTMEAAAASTWTCRAESRGRSGPGHFGWAKRSTEEAAREMALYECAKRTPRWRKCRIVSCKRD